MNRSEFQYARSNYRSLRRDAYQAGKPSGFSASVDLFLATFTRREREALTADKARAEAASLRELCRSPAGYGGGRAYAVAAQIARDCQHRALMLDKLAAELDARK